MLILLPPSEGKRRGGRGRPLANRTVEPDLAEARAHVAAALQRLLDNADRAAIAAALALPESVIDEAVADNARVAVSPTMPALDRYAGVVYDGLAAARLSPKARRLAEREVVVLSGLLGAVRGGDPVPLYRVPAKAVLPDVGVVGTFWRPRLNEVLERRSRGLVVVDLRSSDYAAMWRPTPSAEAWISVRVLSPKPNGDYAVVSYPSKFHKGRLAAALLERQADGGAVRSVQDVLETWDGLGELDGTVRQTRGGVVEVELRTRSAVVVGAG